MALGQREGCIAQNGTEHRQADLGDRIGNERPVALARHAVENHAGDADACLMRHQPAQHGGDRLRLARDIEHRHDGEGKPRREIGRGAAPSARPCNAVE